MNIITVEKAREQGLTKSQIMAAAHWNSYWAVHLDNIGDWKGAKRLKKQSYALEQVAEKL